MLPRGVVQSILQILERNIKEMSKKKKNGVRPVSAFKTGQIGSSLTFILIPENSDPPKDMLVFF